MNETQNTSAARVAGHVKAELIAERLKYERAEAHAHLALCDKIGAICEKLPDYAIEGVAISCGCMMIYGLNKREKVEEVLRCLSAGHWLKRLTEDTRITYSAIIDGVTVELYGVPPPDSCKIIAEEVFVPAHNETRRTLICH